MAVQLKDANKALTRNKKKADETKEQFDDLSRKFEFQENEFSELKREFKELQARYQNSEESNKMLLKQNEGYRNVIVKNEEVLSKQTTELKELQVRMEVQR